MHGRRPALGRVSRGLLTASLALGTAGVATAQSNVATDGSLGMLGPVDVCSGVCGSFEVYEDLGERVGTNLFHSFEFFDVGAGDTALFTSNPGTTTNNVISRVTGGTESQILGGIDTRSIPGASFYLLNPDGVFFGEGSQLAVDGSFHVSTADALRFGDGQEFEASLSGAVPMALPPPAAFGFLLAVDPSEPSSFVFDDDTERPAGISFDETSDLTNGLPSGATFSAVAGEVGVEGPDDTVSMPGLDLAGVIQLAAVDAGSEVPLHLADFDPAGQSAQAQVGIFGNAAVATSSTDAGRIVIRGGRFALEQRAGFATDPTLSATNAGAGADVIDVAVSHDVSLDGAIVQASTLFGSSGDIRLVADTLALSGGSVVEATGILPTVAPSVAIDARDVSLVGGSRVTSRDAGPVEVLADTLAVSAGSRIESLATDLAFADGGSLQIGSDTEPLALLEVGPGGGIFSATTGAFAGGDLTIHADRIEVAASALANAQIAALSQRSVTVQEVVGGPDVVTGVVDNGGQGGDLTIHAGSIDLMGGAQLRAATNTSGDAGTLRLELSGGLTADGVVATPAGLRTSGVFTSSELYAVGEGQELGPNVSPGPTTGDAGLLEIDTPGSVSLTSGAVISASAQTLSQGDTRGLSITAGAVQVAGGSGTGAFSAIAMRSANGAAAPGALSITTDSLEVSGGGFVSTTSTGGADAGSIQLAAHEVDVSGILDLNGDPTGGVLSEGISPNAANAGDAGGIRITPRDGEGLRVTVRDEGRISVNSTLSNAGEIEIRGADSVAVSDGGRITAAAANQSGGGGTPASIRILDTAQLSVSGGTITAETNGNATGGQIEIRAGNVSLEDAFITTRSTLPAGAGGGGDAGDIVIAADQALQATRSVISTEANDAGGGRILLQAPEVVSIVESQVTTSVQSSTLGDDAGDIEIPQIGGPIPGLLVINKSDVIANALGNTNAGDITLSGREVFISADTRIEASAADGAGVDGTIQINAPDSELVGQLARLRSDYVDPSDRLLPPCSARTQRTGSFVVQTREALPPPPDAPLRALPEAATDDGRGPACPVPEESS